MATVEATKRPRRTKTAKPNSPAPSGEPVRLAEALHAIEAATDEQGVMQALRMSPAEDLPTGRLPTEAEAETSLWKIGQALNREERAYNEHAEARKNCTLKVQILESNKHVLNSLLTTIARGGLEEHATVTLKRIADAKAFIRKSECDVKDAREAFNLCKRALKDSRNEREKLLEGETKEYPLFPMGGFID